MNEAIEKFKTAYDEMQKASRSLDRFVEQAINKANSVDALLEIADQLPQGYVGVRRVFEKAEQLIRTRPTPRK